MKAIIICALTVCVLTGCAANPQEVALTLKPDDPKYHSDDCTFIRNKVLDYDDKVGERAVNGMLLGLFLGPFGLPIAASMDADQNKQRELLGTEMKRRCVTEETVAAGPNTPKPKAVAGASDVTTGSIGR